MPKRYFGGIISATQNLATDPSSISGFFSVTEQTQSVQAGRWKLAGLPIIDYILVAGGGSGGSRSGTTTVAGGGGGAGGYVTQSNQTVVSGTTYAVTIGAGGAYGNQGAGSRGLGSDSTFFSQLAYGGGGGGNGGGGTGNTEGQAGGSGGGGSTKTTSGNLAAGSGVAGQGNGGGIGIGTASTTAGTAGGGGGAGAVGTAGNAATDVKGGNGIDAVQFCGAFEGTCSTTINSSTITITAVTKGRLFVGSQITGVFGSGTIIKFGTGTGGTGTYVLSNQAGSSQVGITVSSSVRYIAGGGGAGAKRTGTGTRSPGSGGLGGGGGGVDQSTVTLGATNTGGGGSGADAPAASTTFLAGGAGGSGVLYIRHPASYGSATVTGSPEIYIVDNYRIYEFKSSGSITFFNNV